MTTDPIITAARFLAANLTWTCHQSWVDEFAGDVGDCAGRLRGLVNGPSEQRFLGPCGAVLPFEECPASTHGQCLSMHEGFARCDEGECVHAEERICEGDVYGPRGGRTGRCRACGAEVSTAEREAWLDGQVRNEAYRVSEIADAYGLRENTIRVQAHRGQLKSYWRTVAGIVAEWPPPDGEKHDRLHYLGDVLDLAAADAARRAGEQAKRARRAETEAERMSA